MIKSFVARVGKLLWVLMADQVYWTVCVGCLVKGCLVTGYLITGYLVLGVQEGGEGDTPSNLFLSVKLLSPCSLSEPFTGTFLGSEWLFLKVFWFVLIVDVVLLGLSLGSHVKHLVGLGYDGRGGCDGGVSSILLSTTSSSETALDYGYAEVFLDSACFFLVVMMVQMVEDCRTPRPVYLQPPRQYST